MGGVKDLNVPFLVSMMVMTNIALLATEADFKLVGQGIQRYMQHIAKQLTDIGNNNKNSVLRVEKVVSPVYPLLGNGLSMMAWSFFNRLENKDLIHNLQPTLFYPSKSKKHHGAILTTVFDFLHEIDKQMIEQDLITWRAKLWWSLVIQKTTKYALNSDHLIAISSQTKDEAVQLGFERNKIDVVGMGVSDEFLSQQKVEKAENVFRVGFIGSFNRRKNIEFAIRGFKQANMQNSVFEIWGRPAFEHEKMRALAKGSNIEFKGLAPEKDIIGIYDSFDAFVFPTLYEGFGIPIIEAYARGLPVITYKKARIPEEVKRYCIEAEDEQHMGEILKSLKENGYNSRDRDTATKYASSFSWKRLAEQTWKVYENLAV